MYQDDGHNDDEAEDVSNHQTDDVCFCRIVLGASVSLLLSLMSSFLLSLDSVVMKL